MSKPQPWVEHAATAAVEALKPSLGTAFSAVSLVVAHGDDVVSRALGTMGPHDDTLVTPMTPFDLASITKVYTACAILVAVERGDIALDQPIGAYLPHYDAPEYAGVTVRRILSHTSGLPVSIADMPHAGADAAERWSTFRNAPWETVLSTPLIEEPGKRVIYSDLGYMILGKLLEEITGYTLQQVLTHDVCLPLGLQKTTFGPINGAPTTGVDPVTGAHLMGVVHDPKTRFLGGTSGAAGVFAPALEVSCVARSFLRHTPILNTTLRKEAITEQAHTHGVRYGLGWELRTELPNWPEVPLDPSSFGSQGHTGTIVWTDPKWDLTIVILTNGIAYGNSVSKDGVLTQRLTAATKAITNICDGADMQKPELGTQLA